MGLNAQGIYEYDGTEVGAPGASFQNLLSESVTDTVIDIRADITALDLLTDSDWVTITTIGSGWTATVNHTPRVRKIGDRVDLAGAVTRTGTSGADTDLVTIPVGFRLAGAFLNYFIGASVTSGGTAHTLFLNGVDHKVAAPSGYATASVGSGVVVPLIGSWYVN